MTYFFLIADHKRGAFQGLVWLRVRTLGIFVLARCLLNYVSGFVVVVVGLVVVVVVFVCVCACVRVCVYVC